MLNTSTSLSAATTAITATAPIYTGGAGTVRVRERRFSWADVLVLGGVVGWEW